MPHDVFKARDLDTRLYRPISAPPMSAELDGGNGEYRQDISGEPRRIKLIVLAGSQILCDRIYTNPDL
jgi:hypothetical protein